MNCLPFRRSMAIALLTLQMAGCATQGESKSPNVEVGAPVASATPAPRLPTEPAGAATHAVKPVQVLPPPNETELKYGIQIAQLGLTAAGGLVDVRFKVLDPAKVKSLLSNPANAPMLYAGDKPPLTPPHHALQGARFSQGQVFYILYPNLRGAVQPGVEVTVAMGDVRLGPVKAQ